MAMTKKKWSVSALAVEFGLDRRTVAKRLEGVPSAGQERGSPVWNLSDAAAALSGSSGAAQPAPAAPPVPPGFEKLTKLAPIDQIANFAMMEMARRAPAQAAVLAVAAGADVQTAYALRRAMIVAMAGMTVDVSRMCLVQPLADNPGAALFKLDDFDGCDWQALAAATGERVDLDAWTRHAEQAFAG